GLCGQRVGSWWSPWALPVEHDGHLLVEQLGEDDGLVAVGAWPADAGAVGEGAAWLAALFAEEPFPAAGAFVDGDLSSGPGGGDDDCGGRVLVTSAERGLAAGCAAVPLPPGGGELGSADRAGHRRGVVPRRGRWLGHGVACGPDRAGHRRGVVPRRG